MWRCMRVYKWIAYQQIFSKLKIKVTRDDLLTWSYQNWSQKRAVRKCVVRTLHALAPNRPNTFLPNYVERCTRITAYPEMFDLRLCYFCVYLKANILSLSEKVNKVYAKPVDQHHYFLTTVCTRSNTHAYQIIWIYYIEGVLYELLQ